jgi:hypothetical protein
MHRNKDVLLGEDGYTNPNDNAPANIFSLTSLVHPDICAFQRINHNRDNSRQFP